MNSFAKIDFSNIGAGKLLHLIDGITDHVDEITPVDFNESRRYLPESVSSRPGYISFKVNPFMVEILNCVDINSPVREVNLLKGVQITYTTLLESAIFYMAAHVGTLPIMYMTADKELADLRIQANIIPMFNQSGYADIFQSLDTGNNKKSGKTVDKLQFRNGGTLTPFGARNAAKMRQYSIVLFCKDEMDGWLPLKDEGDLDKITDDRCKGHWERRKILRGSTPKIKATSLIWKAYLRGDQRKYNVGCLKCGYMQDLRWEEYTEDGKRYGIVWEMENGVLVQDSVRYLCKNCQHPHTNYDKERLFHLDNAKWIPTAIPVSPDIRSYHLPALYSPIGMAPWSALVADYLAAWDVENNRVKCFETYQRFYNNNLGMPFEMKGEAVTLQEVSAHRRRAYTMGTIPNRYAMEHSGGRILYLTCEVDVQKYYLSVAVFGWVANTKCYLISYHEISVGAEDPDCTNINSPVWDELREVIEESQFVSDDKIIYKIELTMIDCGWGDSYDTVCTFCDDYSSGVVPIIGRPTGGQASNIKMFDEFQTKSGTVGFKIWVDYYKDRISRALRREWIEESSKIQPKFHFNAPSDITDKQLTELTVESKQEKTNERGVKSYVWFRPSGARNELWDLLVYGHAAVEIRAREICMKTFEQESVHWDDYWQLETERLEERAKDQGIDITAK